MKLREIDLAIKAGATEIDVVISREKVLTGKWRSLYDEIVPYREVCGTRAKLKTILGVGNLETLTNVAAASAVAIMAGSDTIKTSTGFEPTNATLPAAWSWSGRSGGSWIWDSWTAGRSGSSLRAASAPPRRPCCG